MTKLHLTVINAARLCKGPTKKGRRLRERTFDRFADAPAERRCRNCWSRFNEDHAIHVGREP